MSIYQIPNSEGKKWGTLTSHIQLPLGSHIVLGAGLDISIYGLELIETQLLAEMVGTLSTVRKLLYLYFNLPIGARKSEADEVVAEVLSVLRTTRTGLEGEFGSLGIYQNERGTSKLLSGYVRETGFLRRERGEIHLNFPKIMAADLYAGGVYWSRLIVHEATHRYAKTGDLVNKVKLTKREFTDGYLGGDQTNTLAKYDAYVSSGDTLERAREKTVVPKISHISTAQHLTNADSYAFFFSSMLQAYRDTMPIAMKFTGMYRKLAAAAAAFVKAQRKMVPQDMLDIEGMVRFDTFT